MLVFLAVDHIRDAAEMKAKRIRFSDDIQSVEALEYDRKNPYWTAKIPNAEEWMQIRRELDDYKRHEMLIHPESRWMTAFHRPPVTRDNQQWRAKKSAEAGNHTSDDHSHQWLIPRDSLLIVYLLVAVLVALSSFAQWLLPTDDGLFVNHWTLIEDCIETCT